MISDVIIPPKQEPSPEYLTLWPVVPARCWPIKLVSSRECQKTSQYAARIPRSTRKAACFVLCHNPVIHIAAYFTTDRFSPHRSVSPVKCLQLAKIAEWQSRYMGASSLNAFMMDPAPSAMDPRHAEEYSWEMTELFSNECERKKERKKERKVLFMYRIKHHDI